jgi:beta-lactamase superfamily II metal-dependent hydrolase
MIDTGDKDYVDRIEDVLDQYGISYIDAILLTHPDADHIQGGF